MIRFILNNIVDDSTLDTNIPITSEYIVDNVKKISRLRPMRSPDSSSTFIITGELPGTETTEVSAIVIARHNFSVNTTYRVRLLDIIDAEIYDSGTIQVTDTQAATSLYAWGSFNWGAITWGADKKDTDKRQWYDLVWWEPNGNVYSGVHSFELTLDVAGSAGSYAIYCDDVTIYCDDATIDCDQLYLGTGSPLSIGIPYFEIGRLYIGKYVEPTYNTSYGHELSFVEDTQQYRPSSGTLRSDYTTTNRKFNFNLNVIPNTDIETVHKPLISKGLSKDFYISMFPSDSSDDKQIDYSGLMKFTKTPRYTEYINGYYKAQYEVEEI